MLRNRQLHGYKFRRQHAVERYVVDFFCHQAGLVIEIDGPIHQTQLAEDHERQQVLESMGYHVLRFTNDQVLHNPAQVLAQILTALEDPASATPK